MVFEYGVWTEFAMLFASIINTMLFADLLLPIAMKYVLKMVKYVLKQGKFLQKR